MLMWYENVEAILEYSPEKMIMTLRPSIFLFVDEWVAIKHLKQEERNFDQWSLKKLPGFNEDDFPYVVSSGKNYFSLINVKENLVTKFIESGRSL